MSEPKKYSLKESERAVLTNMVNSIMSSFIAHIATERLALTITPNTKFELAPDYSEVQVIEVEPEETGVVDSAAKGKK